MEGWLEKTGESVKLTVVIDPLMIVWATIISVLLTTVREVLNRTLFKVSERRREERGKGGEGKEKWRDEEKAREREGQNF